MSNYRKYTPEEKFKIVKEYLSGESSLKEIGARYRYTYRKGFPGFYHRWIALYKEHGESAF
jgi:transposase-like protein